MTLLSNQSPSRHSSSSIKNDNMDIYEFAELKRLSVRQIFDFTSDVNPIGPSNKAKNAIRRSIKLLEYPPDKRIRYLRRYICKREMIGEDRIVFGHGSSSLMYHLLMAIKPKDILLISPVSRRYRDILDGLGINIHLLHSEEEDRFRFTIDINGIINRLEHVDMVMLPNPHDVTGATLTPEDVTALIDATEKDEKMLVIDESYIDFTTRTSFIKPSSETEHTIVVRTFSNFYALKGLPIGYAVGSCETVRRLTENMCALQLNTLAYAAAMASLKDKGFKKRTIDFIENEKAYIIKKLKCVNDLQIIDTPCNFLLLKTSRDVSDIKNIFLRYNIFVDEYKSISGGGYLRLPINRHKKNAKFVKTLNYIFKA